MAQHLTNTDIDAIKILSKFPCDNDCKNCDFAKDIGNSVCIPNLAQRWISYQKVAGNL